MGLQGDVLFRTGSAEITPEIAHQIQVIAQAVAKSPALKVRVDGSPIRAARWTPI